MEKRKYPLFLIDCKSVPYSVINQEEEVIAAKEKLFSSGYDDFHMENGRKEGKYEDKILFRDSYDNVDLTSSVDCVNHHDKTATILHEHYFSNSAYLNVTTGKDSKCLQIFEEVDCKGPSVQFLNVDDKGVYLKRNWIGRNAKEKGKLLNLNLVPASYKKCPQKATSEKDRLIQMNYLKEKYCNANLLIRMKFQTRAKTIKLLDTCVNVGKPARPKEPFVVPDMELSVIKSRQEYTDKDDKQLESDICLELYKEEHCGGSVIRFFITSGALIPSDKYFSPAYTHSRIIWEYFSSTTGEIFIDTDVKSLRKCFFCLENDAELIKNHTTHISNPNTEEESQGESHSAEIVSPAATEDDENVEEEHISCHFRNCQTISVYLDEMKGIETKSESCAFLFNDTSCSKQPVLQISGRNTTDMSQILTKYQEFARWSLTSCDDSPFDRNRNTFTDCLLPTGSNLTLQSLFPKGFVDDGLSKKTSSFLNKVILAGGAIVGFVFFILVILVACRLSREVL